MKRIQRYCLAAIIEGALLTLASPVARAEDPKTDGYVTRKEYDELKAQMLVMKKELDALKKERTALRRKRKAGPRQEHTERAAVAETHEVAPPQGQAAADTHKQVATEVTPPVVEAEGSDRKSVV